MKKKFMYFINLLVFIVSINVVVANEVDRIKMVKFYGKSLEKNLLGEKAEREIGIYLPYNYENENTSYPVIYFLVGYGNRVFDFQQWSNLEKTIKIMREDKSIKDMIVVIVDGETKAGGSFYVNSPTFGNWEEYISKDLVEYVDNNYRTIKSNKSRGLAGHSMGGFGVINIGMKYPEVFGTVYSMNPGLFDKNGLEEDFFYNHKKIEDEYKITDKFNGIDEKLTNIRLKRLLNAVTIEVSYGMAFSYIEKAPYYELPYDVIDGKYIKNDIKWNNWERGFGDFDKKVEKYKDNMIQLNGFVIDYGVNDSYKWIPKGCIYLDELLKKNNIPHEMRPNQGDHGNLIQERMTKYMFPYFSEKLK